MRVLLVTDWLRQRGGVERYFSTLRDGLRAAGHEAWLLTSTAGSAADGTAEFTAFGTERRSFQSVLQIANPAASATARRAVRATAPDVALVGMYEQHLSPSVMGGLGEVPTVLSVGDYKPVCPIHTKLLPGGMVCTTPAGTVCWRGGCVGLAHWLRDRPRYARIRAAFQAADGVVTCGTWLQSQLAAEGIPSDVLHLPVAPVPPSFARARSISPTLLFVGRLSREKGVDVLLAAFAIVAARVSDSHLRIVGDGDEREALEELADDLAVEHRVSFAGWGSSADVERELSSAWALVAPSVWPEPFGLVAVEAITRGVPVVASATGGFCETVSPGTTGLLVPPRDVPALADALEAVTTGRAFGDGLPAATVAEARVEHGIGRHITKLIAIFDDAIVRHETRRAPTRSSARGA